MKIIIIVVLILFFSVILYPTEMSKENIQSSSDNISRNDNNQYFQKQFFDSLLFKFIIAVISLIIGFFIQKLIGRDTIRFANVADRANTIRDIFISDFERIKDLDINQDDRAGDVVVDNIINTDILVRKIFPYISLIKRKQIERHYNKYKEPYISNHNAIVMLKGLREISGRNGNNPSIYYSNPKIPNAREIAIKHLKVLIDDFKRI